jgi:hypothetical protein
MTGSNKVTLKNTGGTNGVDFSGAGSGAEQGLVISDGLHTREVLRTVSIGAFNAFTSAVIAAVSNVPLDNTLGADADLMLLHDTSENGSLNHVPVSTFFKNVFSDIPVVTSLGTTDRFMIYDIATSTGRVVTPPNAMKVINSLTVDTQPNGTADFAPTYDASAATGKKVALKDFNSPGYSEKSAGYTVLDADRNTLIRFSGLSADATLALPAASGRAGFIVYIRNDDATYGVIVDPNSTELIDGLSTRRTNGPNSITLLCDGTGWRTISGSYLFRSAGQTVTAGGLLTIAHGLGVQPKRVWYYYKCTTASAGFSIGDEVFDFAVDTNSGAITGYSTYTDATNLNIRAGTGATVFTLVNKSTGAHVTISGAGLGNWELIVCADSR